MGRSKNFENMTHEERCEFWAKERMREQRERQAIIDTMQPDMIEAVKKLRHIAWDVSTDMMQSGVDHITVKQMQDLHDASESINRLFNIEEN